MPSHRQAMRQQTGGWITAAAGKSRPSGDARRLGLPAAKLTVGIPLAQPTKGAAAPTPVEPIPSEAAPGGANASPNGALRLGASAGAHLRGATTAVPEVRRRDLTVFGAKSTIDPDGYGRITPTMALEFLSLKRAKRKIEAGNAELKRSGHD